MTTNNGDNKSSGGTAEERLSNLDKALDAYERGVLGLRDNSHSHEADKYLNLTTQELRTLEPAELGEAYYILQRYAFFLQRTINREKSHALWAKKTLDSSLAGEIEQLRSKTYTSYDERRALAIRQSEFARKLDKLQLLAELRVQELDFLVPSINKIVDAINEQRRIKSDQRTA